jgi:hypothetical protein
MCTNKVIKKSIYREGIVNICNALNKGLPEILALVPVIISWISFLIHTFSICRVAPESNSILHYRSRQAEHFKCVYIIKLMHKSKYITNTTHF